MCVGGGGVGLAGNNLDEISVLCYFKAFLGKTSQKVPFFDNSGR